VTRTQADRIVAALEVFIAAKRDLESRRIQSGHAPYAVAKAFDVAREALVVSFEVVPTAPTGAGE